VDDVTLRRRRLSQLAGDTGLSIADVAVLAGLDETTVGRLWDAVDWLDRIRGRTLQALIAAVPGVGAYVAHAPVQARRTQLVHALATEGIKVDLDALQRIPDSATLPYTYIGHALEAALHVVRGDVERTTAHLPRFWGQVPDRALDILFRPKDGLLLDAAPLLAAAVALTPQLIRPAYSFNTILAQAHLAHHIAKATGQPTDLGQSKPIRDRRWAFAARSNTMGALSSTEDPEPAERYRRLVDDEPAVRMVEEWAFPSWTRDCRPTTDMTLPGSLLLRRTAAEVLREISSYGEGYLHYLVTTYLPLALDRDPTFGLQVDQLRAALLVRRDSVYDPIIRCSIERFVRCVPTGVT
jgi:hypothetical protein